MPHRSLREYHQKARDTFELHFFDRPLGLLLVIGYKAIWGLASVTSGIFVILQIPNYAVALSNDTQDLFWRWIFEKFALYHLNPSTFSTVIIGLGITKILLAICLWYRFQLIRDIGLAFFSAMGIYGIYHATTHFSLITSFALFVDICAVLYFWKILPIHLTKEHIYE